MTDKQINRKYCDGIDCGWCGEKEPCIYRIADNLEERLQAKEQEFERLKEIANNALDKVNNYLDKKEKSLLYKQTLNDIQEIVLAGKMKVFVNMDVFWDEILQKIDECEVDNGN